MSSKHKTHSKSERQNEAEWEEKILNEVLKHAVNNQNKLDFDKLRSSGVTLTLEELYSDDNATDTP